VGTGAAMLLLDRSLLAEVAEVCDRITYIELNVNMELMNEFRALCSYHTRIPSCFLRCKSRKEHMGEESDMENQVFERNKYILKGRKFLMKGSHVLVSLCGTLVVLNALLVYCILFSNQGIPGFRQQKSQVEEVERKIHKLKEENQRIFQHIQGFKQNTQAQERFVRQQLGWAKENELVFEFTQPRRSVAPGK